VTTDAYAWLYKLAVSDEVGWRWRWRGHHPSPEAFAQRLWQDILVQYVVVDRRTSAPIGLLQAYGHDPGARHCHITVMFDPTVHRVGWHLEAVELFISHLFDRWGMQKIYAEAHALNEQQFASGMGSAFVEEGRYPEHVEYQGQLVDFAIFAAYADDWHRHREQGFTGRQQSLRDLL